MSGPNAELQSALTQFTTQPGVSADQAVQLRAAVTGTPALLNKLNQDAHSGHLTGFALQTPGGTANLVGTFDLQTGVMTLPNSSFQASGTAPSADLKATLKLQDMSLRLGHSSYLDVANVSQPVTKDMLDNLQSVMNDSPVLAQQMKDAVNAQPKPLLEQFAILDPKLGAGGTYSDRSNTMSLPVNSLQTNTQGHFNAIDLTFVLGHEMQHGFNAVEKAAASGVFKTQITNIAQSNNPTHDYTMPIGKYIEAGRKDETKAELAGWNTVLSNLQVANPTAGLTEMYNTNNSRMRDFVELDATQNVVAKSGLSFNPNASLSQTTGNIEGMGVHYFDKPSAANFPNLPMQQTTNLGFYRESDYINYYGANAISNVINFERAFSHPVNGVAPQLHINMMQLHLEERLMERLGISIGANPNTPQKYYDTSQTIPSVHHFDHTNTTGTPTSHQHVPVTPNAPTTRVDDLNSLDKSQAPAVIRSGLAPSKPTSDETPDTTTPNKSTQLGHPSNTEHPFHNVYNQVTAHVEKEDEKQGRKSDEKSERLIMAVTALAANDGIKHIDHLVFSKENPERGIKAGENLIIVQGGLLDPAHERADMKTVLAINTPVEQSIKQLDATHQRQTQEAQSLAQQQTQSQSAPTPRGPAMA